MSNLRRSIRRASVPVSVYVGQFCARSPMLQVSWLKTTVSSKRLYIQRTKIVAFLIGYIFSIAIAGIYLPEPASADSIVYEASQSASTGTSTTITITKPTGVISNDMLIAVIGVSNSDATITPPDGTWTSILKSNSATDVTVQSFWKRAGGSEGANYTFTIAAARRIAGGIVSYRGVDTSSTPTTGTPATTTGSASSSLDVASITPGVNKARIVGVYGMSDAAPRTFTPPTTTGVTERVDVSSSDGAAIDISVEVTDYPQSTAAAFDPANATASGTGIWATHQLALKPDGVQHMILFWDGGGAAPTGWSYVTEAEGRFVRGESVANYGAIGGQNDHNHTMTTPTLGAPSSERNGPSGTGYSASSHTHGMPTNTSTAVTNGNIPVFKTLRLIRYDTGIPNTIPSGGIAIFDNSPGIPASGWTQLASQNAQAVKVDSVVGTTGGADTHTHSISWSGSLTAASGQSDNACLLGLGCDNTASITHTHTVSATATTSNSISNLPPYIQPLLAKANADTSVLSLGLTAMFDGAPGGGWVVRSDTGGPYYRKFMRPNSTYNEAGGGAVGHTPSGGTKTSGAANSSNTTNGGNGAAEAGHTHVITPVFTTYTSDSLYTSNNDYFLPPYYNIVVAEKVNFIFNHYAWYDDPNIAANTVSSRYSSLDVAQDSHIIPVPTGYNPPDINQELRLRIQVLVNNSDLAADEIEFKLQFKEDTTTTLTATTCTDGSWTDVEDNGGSSIWKYASSPTTDGSQLTGTTVFSPASTTFQRYVKSNTAGKNIGAVTAGNSMEWDYHIVNDNAVPATQYRFRLVEDSGILLSQYGFGSPTVTPLCPTLTTKPHPENQLRHGVFFDNTGTEKGFSWVD